LGTTRGFSIGEGVDCRLSLDVFECAISEQKMGRTENEGGMKKG
jgi:hypothetical protein